MSADLTTPAELAEILKATEEQVLRWRRDHRWPSFKVGKTIRFTPEQVEQIIASHSETPERPAVDLDSVLEGQTKRSARRSA